MRWTKFTLSTVAGAALAAAAFSPTTARATGDMIGSLGSGGVAKGDISLKAGETDRIGADLDAGTTADIAFSASFQATLVFTDPDGKTVNTGFTSGTKLKLKAFPIATAGTYAFAVSSADGSQGVYSLVVKENWAKTIPIDGFGRQTIDFSMPASGKISAVVTRGKSAPGRPRILDLSSPGGPLLPAPIEPKGNSVKLPAVPTTQAGWYHLTVAADDSISSFQGKITRTVRASKPAHVSLINGIDAVSWSNAGVDNVFKRNCAGCHSWAGSWGGARAYARNALGRMKSGNMPPGGRVPAEQISLVQQWIATGTAR
ncbi:MAG: hypothetical protein K8T90_22045 [Planctomycetes bacterium]|nr:hypothetical protein [Planctomycetota bacterium]